MLARKLGILSLLSIALPVVAQLPDAPKLVFKLDKPTVVAAGTFKGTITLTFAEGLHGYQNPPADPNEIPISVVAKGAKVLKVAYPKGIEFKMGGADKPSLVYTGTITIPVTFKANPKAGKQAFSVVVSYQQCNEGSCFPPGDLTAKSVITVTAPAKKKAAKS